MYTLKGFLKTDKESAKDPNSISAWGEISTQALTYAKRVSLYIDNLTDIELIVFTSRDSSTGDVNVNSAIRNKIFLISNWLLDLQANASTRINDRATLLSRLTDTFNTDLTSINIGDLIVDAEGVYFPEWIGFSVLYTGTTFIENQVKVWYSNNAFLNQYDENEIIVIPPVENIDDLFSTKTSVTTKAKIFQDNLLISKIQEAKGILPESSITDSDYLWKETGNPTNTLMLNWVTIIYGNIGNNIDAIKLAIKQYILSHSTKPEADWKFILPDIFTNTSFYIMPRWKNYAIQERAIEAGQYSTIVNAFKELTYVKNHLPLLPSGFVEDNLRFMPTNYKSVALNVIGDTTNRDNMYSIESIFSDILNVPTTDMLFESMNVVTREFLLKLTRALKLAEETGVYDSVPFGYNKVTINNVMYITFIDNAITYLISTKVTTPGY